MPLALVFAFVAGLVTIVAPCTLPILPLMVGASALGPRRNPVLIVAGFGVVFVLATVGLASALAAAGLTTSGLRLLAGAALTVLGLTLVVPALERWRERELSRVASLGGRVAGGRAGGSAADLLLGAAIGLLWAPCAGPLMAGVIAVAVAQGPTLDGLAVAAAYVAGAAIPLLAVALAGRRATRAAHGPGQRRMAMRALGVLMAAAGVANLTGLDVALAAGTPLVAIGEPGASTAAAGPAFGTGPAGGAGGQAAQGSGSATGAVPVPLEDLGPAPELTGITAWINSPPTTLAALRGKVVLVHFWTFACINCQHVQPYVKAWYAQYASDGFVVLGIHTPELSFERDLGNVRDAVARDGVTFPVAFDPAFATWRAYHNSYWPAFYFIDRHGHIRHTHFGEGDYATSEAVIRTLLAEPAGG